LVRSENPHSVKRGLGLLLGRQFAADDPVLLERPLALHFGLKIKISAFQHEIQKGKGSRWAAEQRKHTN